MGVAESLTVRAMQSNLRMRALRQIVSPATPPLTARPAAGFLRLLVQTEPKALRGGNLSPFPPGDHGRCQVLLVSEARERNAANMQDNEHQRDIRDGLMHLFAQ